MNTAAQKAEQSDSTRPPARYRPTGRAWFHNLALTIVILSSWPIAKVLALIERRWTNE